MAALPFMKTVGKYSELSILDYGHILNPHFDPVPKSWLHLFNQDICMPKACTDPLLSLLVISSLVFPTVQFHCVGGGF